MVAQIKRFGVYFLVRVFGTIVYIHYFFSIWNVGSGECIRVLEGHEELVRCIRFDSKRIVSGAYDGKIKVWDLVAALDLESAYHTLCLQTLEVRITGLDV